MAKHQRITEKEEKNQEYTESYVQIIKYLEKHQDVGVALGALHMISVRRSPHPDAEVNGAFFSSIDGLIAAERADKPTFTNRCPAILEWKLINQEKFLRKEINASLKEGEAQRVDQLIEFNGYINYFMTLINSMKLGYNWYRTFFKFQNLTIEKEKEIIDYLKERTTISVVPISLAISILFIRAFLSIVLRIL